MLIYTVRVLVSHIKYAHERGDQQVAAAVVPNEKVKHKYHAESRKRDADQTNIKFCLKLSIFTQIAFSFQFYIPLPISFLYIWDLQDCH